MTIWSSSQADACPPVYYTQWWHHTFSSIAGRQAGNLLIQIFLVIGLTRPGIKLRSTVSVADTLSTGLLIGYSLTSH